MPVALSMFTKKTACSSGRMPKYICIDPYYNVQRAYSVSRAKNDTIHINY